MTCPSAYNLSHFRFNRKFNGSLKVSQTRTPLGCECKFWFSIQSSLFLAQSSGSSQTMRLSRCCVPSTYNPSYARFIYKFNGSLTDSQTRTPLGVSANSGSDWCRIYFWHSCQNFSRQQLFSQWCFPTYNLSYSRFKYRINGSLSSFQTYAPPGCECKR